MCGKLAMKILSSNFISFRGFFNCCEYTQMFAFPVYHNGRTPFLRGFAPRNSFDTRGIRSNSFNIHLVLGFCRFSEIFKPIIAWISVFMVDKICRPFTRNHCPNDPVSLIKFFVNADKDATIRRDASSNITNINPFAVSCFPYKNASFWVIMQHFVQLFWCKHFHKLPELSSRHKR